MKLEVAEHVPTQDLDDRELLRRYQAGEDEAFTLLYRRHTRILLFYSRSLLGDPGQAEDVVQEAFLRILDCDPKTVRVSLQALLYTTVRNLSIDLGRKADVRKRGKEALLREAGNAPQIPEGPSDELNSALGQLPRDQREAVILKVNSGFTFQEISDLLGNPLPTVMARYRYAIEKLVTMCSEKRGES